MGFKVFLLLLTCILLCIQAKLSEDELRDYLENTYETEASSWCNKKNMAEFNRYTDLENKLKEEIMKNYTLEMSQWKRDIWIKHFRDVSPDDYKDRYLKRQVRKLRRLGDYALEKDKLKQLLDIKTEMSKIYNTAKICPYSNPNCNLDIDGIGKDRAIAKSIQPDELAYAWKAWRDATGAKIKHLYKPYVDLSNEAAKINGYSDKGAFWRDEYEDPNFVEDLEILWVELQPIYTEVHKYLSRKIKQYYGKKIVLSDGLIPDHIFWMREVPAISAPFPGASLVNFDKNLKEKGYTVPALLWTAEEFFLSLGLLPMSVCYNETAGAQIYKPTDGRKSLCDASSWDLCDGTDFRLLMCAQADSYNFVTMHHEMGHIQYFMQYKDQLHTFRAGANPGFHEAIGDTLALSVYTIQHLKRIKLLTNYTASYEATMNYLVEKAVSKVSFVPYAILFDTWRWDVFSGAVPENKWNSHWWELRKKYQKVGPPMKRSDETDLEPGAFTHVPEDVPYIMAFVSNLLQFQLYRSLCIAAGQYDPDDKTIPLHECDFYESHKAGDLLRAGMELGSSRHWSEILGIMTGNDKLSSEPFLEYLEPAHNFLKIENDKYDSYLRYTPKLKINICNMDRNGRILQKLKLDNYPSFTCIQKHTTNIAWCEQ